MKRNKFCISIFFVLLPLKLISQENPKFIDPDNLLTKQETIAIEKAFKYEIDFFNRLFQDNKVNSTDIKFTVAPNFVAFVNEQVRYGTLHANSSGFFSANDSTLVVLKDSKMSSSDFLSVCYHELSHALLRLHIGKKIVPLWFDEGLAEYLEKMSYDKKKVTHRVDTYNLARVKTIIELKDLNFKEFVNWSYQKFYEESFSQEAYGYAIGYSMVFFFLQKGEDSAFVIFRNLKDIYSTIEVLDEFYPKGSVQFEKDFIAYFSR